MNSIHQVDNSYYLYGSPVSYYTVKVRSYLRYKGLPFSQHRVSEKIAKDIIEPATGGWRVVPVLKTPQGDCIQDSSIILDELESVHQDRSITPPYLKQQVVSSLFELLGDDWLPRFIGKVDYRIKGGDGKRLCTPYSQWMTSGYCNR